MTFNYMRDPRLKGRYHEWLAKQSTNAHNVRGLDYNRPRQAINAVQGRQYHTATRRPLYTLGQRFQSVYRNRPNEQSGMPKPAAPSRPQILLPTRRGY